MTRPRLGWHFLRAKSTLRDGRMVRVGQWLKHPKGEPLVMCHQGYHLSIKARDALMHAPGPWVCRVEWRGESIEGSDKVVARERRIVWQADATDVLRKYARLCALDVVHLWDAPRVVVRYLKTGDEALRDATRAAAHAHAAAYAADAYAVDADAAAYAAYAYAAHAYAVDAAAVATAAAATATADAAANEAKQSRRLNRMLGGLKP